MEQASHKPLARENPGQPGDKSAAPPPLTTEDEFRLTKPWMIVGLLAILLGIGAGIIMSSATLIK